MIKLIYYYLIYQNQNKDILLINHQIIHIKLKGVVIIDLIQLIKLLLHHLLALTLLPIHPTITLVSSLRLHKLTPFDPAQKLFSLTSKGHHLTAKIIQR